MRLCIVVPSHWEAYMGGSQYQAKVLIDYFLEHYDAEIVYLTTRHDPQFQPDGYRIVRFSEHGGLRRYGFFFDTFRLYAALRDIAPDAILQFVGCAHTGIAAHYARRHGCRMVWRVTNDKSVQPLDARWWQLHRRIERMYLDYGIRNSDLILAQTKFQADQLAARFPDRSIVVLQNFHPTPPDRERTAQPTKRVLWIANFKKLKNPAAFVRLARSFASRRDVTFAMIGQASASDPWAQEQLALIGETPNIEYLGERTQDEVNAELDRADLLVNTSDYEGFSNTFIQAWMRRVPVVTLGVDPDGLLGSGRLGLVGGSEEGLRESVARLLEDDAERLRMAARCRAHAVAAHDRANVARIGKLLDVPPLPPMRPRHEAWSES
jgi:glycosyltransferase involved in cell wall biosynthesis